MTSTTNRSSSSGDLVLGLFSAEGNDGSESALVELLGTAVLLELQLLLPNCRVLLLQLGTARCLCVAIGSFANF
jgi:hypothetical protein